MDVKYDKIDGLYAMLTIKLEENDYQPKVKKQLHDINMRRPEPGFRPGKVPASLLQRKYGKAVKYDVINHEVSETLYNYIQENKIHTLGDPVPQKNDDFKIEDTEFTFSFKVGLFPQLDIKADKEVTVPYYTIKVDDEMVKRQDDMLCKRYGKQVPGEEVEADSLVKGVITELDEAGAPKDGGLVVESGIVSPQYFTSEEQRNLFVGKKLNETVRFNPSATCNGNETELASMLNIAKEETAAHTGDFNLEIKEIIVLRPAEHNLELFDLVFGKDAVKTEEEYFGKLKEMIAARLKADSDYRFSIDAKDILLKNAGDVQLPDESLKEAIKVNNDGKLTQEQIDANYEQYKPELVWYVVRDTISLQLGIKIGDDDINETAKNIALQQFAQYGLNNVPDDALDRYTKQLLEDKNTRERIVQQTYELKFFNSVKEAVTLDNKDVDVKEFNALFGQPETTEE